MGDLDFEASAASTVIVAAEPDGYVARRLTILDPKSPVCEVGEAEFAGLPGAKILLGEPGMGKSELMSELGRLLGADVVTAVRLISSKNPARLLKDDKPLLIDALDEAMSRRDGDAIDMVLAQIEEVGAPEFTLSCRSREWQSRSVTDLRAMYGSEPTVARIEPFTRHEASLFLRITHPTVDAAHVLDHLDRHHLQELYGNPLTLGLMGRVAESDDSLPKTRAALFERVCELTWPEHDIRRQQTALAQLSHDDALDAAGAIAAALLFAGAEIASSAGAGSVQDGDLRLTDLQRLPNASRAPEIFQSKLFVSVGATRAKPMHRVVAEFLAARWLSRQAQTPRVQRRLLAQLQGNGAVPASLRGLHAWLAHHSHSMAERVIGADPYGVLRYGEVASLSPHLASFLLDALVNLADDDPYFRSQDWTPQIAAGLMIPALRPNIRAIIAHDSGNAHLRSLLIEGLKGSGLAAELSDELEAIIFAQDRNYNERSGAAEALLPHRDRGWWRIAIGILGNQTGSSPRLARHLIERIELDVPDELLIATVFAETGLTRCRLPRNRRRVHEIRHYNRLAEALPASRVANVLNRMADYGALIDDRGWEKGHDVADLATRLLVRGIKEGFVEPAHASQMWRWLGIAEHTNRYNRRPQQELRAALSKDHDLRRAIQLYVMDNERGESSVQAMELKLHRRLVPFAARAGDLGAMLHRLSLGNTKDPALRQDWKTFMALGRTPDGLPSELVEAGEAFRRGDKELAEFARRLEIPPKAAWEKKQDRELAKRARKHRVQFEHLRRDLIKIGSDLAAGDWQAIYRPAKAYFIDVDGLPDKLAPIDRMTQLLGSTLRDEALLGFEAGLHRHDLPSADEVAAGLAEGICDPRRYGILAGLYERIKAGRDLSDISVSLKEVALLLVYEHPELSIEEHKATLKAALEKDLFSTPQSRLEFARLWIEPSLVSEAEDVLGLYPLARETDWQAAGAELASEWLINFPNAPLPVEERLVDCLTYGGALEALRDIAALRASSPFRSKEHLLCWLAIEVVVRFDAVQPDLAGVAQKNPEFIWTLRDRIQLERRGRTVPIGVEQAAWIIREFRTAWPYATLEGSGRGDTNDYDATNFLRGLIDRLANDTSLEASNALTQLVAQTSDSYSDLIRHMAAQQRQKRAEESFLPLAPMQLGALLEDGPPGSIEDLKAVVLEEMAVAQRKLIGDETDPVVEFWDDENVPREENRCRDRLADLIAPELRRYDVLRLTEADMPMDKRADLAFARASLQLPIEVKGQWHRDVWDAAEGQLAAQYLVDWRSEQRGIYCVLWFGNLTSTSGRRLKAHPDGLAAPQTAEEMRQMLVARIPDARRSMIEVVVLDLTAGRA